MPFLFVRSENLEGLKKEHWRRRSAVKFAIHLLDNCMKSDFF